MIDSLVPHVDYHPFLLPKSRGVDKDPYTSEIITVTHYALHITNPQLAEDCCLSLALGNQWPLMVPLLNDSICPQDPSDNCTCNIPFKVQPMGFNNSVCFYKLFKNNSFDIDVGQASLTPVIL